MVLYLESQLDEAYREYCLMQVRHNVAFVQREDFRALYEKLMEQVALMGNEYSSKFNLVAGPALFDDIVETVSIYLIFFLKTLDRL